MGAPKRHPLRGWRVLVVGIRTSMRAKFDAVYTDNGRPSIAPEQTLLAFFLRVQFSVRSARLLDQIEYNLL